MKQVNFIKYLAFLGALMVAFMTSCVDEDFDMPPENNSLKTDTVLTIKEVRDMVQSKDDKYIFEDSVSVCGVVTMDDKLGNIYKTAYIQDSTGAIALHQNGYGGIYQGDSVRLFLEGLQVGTFNNLIQIDSQDEDGFLLDSHIVKLDVNVRINPRSLTLEELKEYDEFFPKYQGELIKLTDVQFVAEDTSKTFADAENGDNRPRSITLESLDGETIVVSTSDYAEFAGEPVPNGRGTFIGIFSQYDDELQLKIRNPEELDMEGERFSAIYMEEFDDETLDGWTTYSVTGAQVWEIGNHYGDNPYAVMSGYDYGDNENEDWLISKGFKLDGSNNEHFSFKTAKNYEGKDLKVFYSVDYDGNGDPTGYNWTEFDNYTLSTGNFNWVNSGGLDISFIGDGEIIYFAFVYESTNNNAATWQVDDIKIIATKK